MKLIRSLMGRRQFLIGATVASTSALVYKKLAGVVAPGFQTGVAMAAENTWSADLNQVSDKYKHLMSPLKIGNVVLKNRMLCPQSTPHFLQGPENFPSEIMRDYYVALAKNGAGIISVRIMSNRVRSELRGDSAHMIIYDLEDYGVQNYIEQMVEGIHIYGSKACAGIMAGMRRVPGGPGPGPAGAPGQEEGGRGDGGRGAPMQAPEQGGPRPVCQPRKCRRCLRVS